MATKTNIPTKATGDNLTAAEFNELNSNYNTAVDDVNANKTQTEAEAIQLLRLHNPDLVFQGFVTFFFHDAATTENTKNDGQPKASTYTPETGPT